MMRKATREARTLAISANAVAVAWRAVANATKAEPDAFLAWIMDKHADRYWLRLARTLKGRG